jgi:hypothetical protein
MSTGTPILDRETGAALRAQERETVWAEAVAIDRHTHSSVASAM